MKVFNAYSSDIKIAYANFILVMKLDTELKKGRIVFTVSTTKHLCRKYSAKL